MRSFALALHKLSCTRQCENRHSSRSFSLFLYGKLPSAAPSFYAIMKKTIYNKYDKRLIGQLPPVVFEGRIVVVLSADEADRAVDYLLSQPILGIDTETRPAFKKGVHHTVSLLQVSSHDVCFLFRLKHTGMSPAIIRLLEDKTVPKVGLSLHDDLLMLHHVAAFTPGSFIDLQHHVSEIGVEDMSLQKLYANFFGQKISKGQRLTNWDADILTEKQKQYAATDAWTCIRLYEELQRLEATGDYELVTVEEGNDHVKADIS